METINNISLENKIHNAVEYSLTAKKVHDALVFLNGSKACKGGQTHDYQNQSKHKWIDVFFYQLPSDILAVNGIIYPFLSKI